MDIEDWRAEIDLVDEELLSLLNRRARLALKVGALKRLGGLPLVDPERERIVLGRIEQLNTGPLDDRAVNSIFRRIIRESRNAEMLVQESESIERAV